MYYTKSGENPHGERRRQRVHSHLVEEVLGLNYGKLLLAPDTGDHDPLHPRPDPLFLRKKEAHFSTVLMK